MTWCPPTFLILLVYKVQIVLYVNVLINWSFYKLYEVTAK